MGRHEIVDLLNKGQAWVLFYEYFKSHSKFQLSQNDFIHIFKMWEFSNKEAAQNFLLVKMKEHHIVILSDIQTGRIIRYE